MSIFLSGLVLGFSLILAIGAQNAFVLRQGLRRAYVLPVVLACALSDALLIIIGVSGFGWLNQVMPWLTPVMRYGGAAFLFCYGVLAFKSAWSGTDSLKASGADQSNWIRAVMTCLMLTWLNPHVYLDTVVLIGSIAAQYGAQKYLFGAGAVASSFIFFFSLGFGARYLSAFFARPAAWRVLDLCIGLIMCAISVTLISKS